MVSPASFRTDSVACTMSSLNPGLAPASVDPPSLLSASPATRSPPTGSRIEMLPGVWPGVAITCRPNTSSPSPTARRGRGEVIWAMSGSPA